MRKTWKQALAMVCTAAMVMTGVNWPVMNAEAAEYNTVVSESGYKKAEIVDATSGCGWSEGDYSTLYDGNVNTHWHSHYNGSGVGDAIGNTTTSDKNWVSVTLKEAQDIMGVVYIPRQHKAGADANGTFKTFKVMVSTSEDGDDWKNVDIAKVDGEKVETSGYSNDAEGHYVTFENYTLDSTTNYAKGKELIFKNIQHGVKRVKFVAKETYGGNANSFMNAAELCVLMPGKYISDEILAANAVANSYMGKIATDGSVTGAWSDGPVSWAFDDDEHWWHSKYNYVYDSGYGHGTIETPTAENPIYMATGFDEAKYVTGFYYESRSASGRITSYKISVANQEDPMTEFLDPTDSTATTEEGKISVNDVEWTDIYAVENGTAEGNPQKLNIVFDKPVLATHIKLTVYSTDGDTHVMAKRIRVSEMEPQVVLKDRIDAVENVINKTEEMNIVLTSANAVLTKENASIDEIDEQVQKLNAIIENLAAENIELDKTELNLRYYEGHTHRKQLNAKIYPYAADQAVNWSSDNESVATVDENGMVKTTGVGTATITATASNNSEVTAKCTVNVAAIEKLDNISLNKTASTNATVTTGNIGQIVDGDKWYYADLGVAQAGDYAQIDLGALHDIDALRLYRYYGDGRTYYATVIALAENEEDFSDGNAVVVWNSDYENVHGFGRGKDITYSETSAGFDFVTNETVTARYARVYMLGSSKNNSNHIIEFEVYGSERLSDTCKIASSSITLTGKIGLNFYAKVAEDKVSDAVMNLTLNGRTESYNVADLPTTTINDETYYVATQKLAAAQMTEEVTAELLIGDTSVSTRKQTVKAYADKIIAAGDTYGENLVALVKAMLHYGAYAQKQFNTNTDKLANDGLDPVELDASSMQVPNKSFDVTINNIVKPVTFATLVLDSGTSMRYVLKEELVTGIDQYKFAINGKTVEVKTGSKYTYVEYEDIPAALLDDTYTLTITKDGESVNVVYSPLNYVKDTIDTTDSETASDTLKDVVKALYMYNAAANTYFNK